MAFLVQFCSSVIYSSQLDGILLSTDSPAWRRFHPKVQPLPFQIPLLMKEVYPLIYPPVKNWCPFLILTNSKSFFNNHNMKHLIN